MRSALCLTAALLVLLPCVLASGSNSTFDARGVFRGDWLPRLGLDEEAMLANAQQQLYPRRGIHATIATDSGCCECAGKTAKHIIDSVLEEVHQACANVTCPVLKKYCQYVSDYEERYTGYLTARLHPAALGFSYCMGTGECQHPNATALADKLLFGPRARDDLPLLQLPAVSRLLPATLESQVPILLTEESIDEGVGRPMCHHCERKAVKYVMKKAIKGVKEACKKTDCPKLKEICKWAKEHKEFSRGYIYGKVEPWKFAIGYCSSQQCRA